MDVTTPLHRLHHLLPPQWSVGTISEDSSSQIFVILYFAFDPLTDLRPKLPLPSGFPNQDQTRLRASGPLDVTGKAHLYK